MAERIVETKNQGNEVVVVVSRDGRHHRRFAGPRRQVCPATPPPRELDMLLTAGERISTHWSRWPSTVWAPQARSFTGSQAGDHHRDARQRQDHRCHSGRLREALDQGQIVLVAASRASARTAGRHHAGTRRLRHDGCGTGGGSEGRCLRIYTDVDGIFTADPRIVPNARRSTPSASRRCRWRPAAPRC